MTSQPWFAVVGMTDPEPSQARPTIDERRATDTDQPPQTEVAGAGNRDIDKLWTDAATSL